MITFREPRAADAHDVAVVMAEIDVAECRAMGFAPWPALYQGMMQSAICWTGEIDGEPNAMFGLVVGSAVTDLGHPWFLGSEKARRNARAFLEIAPDYLRRMEVFCSRLDGHVAQRNRPAIRWLRRMGFVVEEQEPILMRGEPMLRFHKGF